MKSFKLYFNLTLIHIHKLKVLIIFDKIKQTIYCCIFFYFTKNNINNYTIIKLILIQKSILTYCGIISITAAPFSEGGNGITTGVFILLGAAVTCPC